jgi:hypothetical protein
MQHDVEKTEHHMKPSAKNMQINEQLFKSQAFCGVHLALNSEAKQLQLTLLPQQDKCLISEEVKDLKVLVSSSQQKHGLKL